MEWRLRGALVSFFPPILIARDCGIGEAVIVNWFPFDFVRRPAPRGSTGKIRAAQDNERPDESESGDHPVSQGIAGHSGWERGDIALRTMRLALTSCMPAGALPPGLPARRTLTGVMK